MLVIAEPAHVAVGLQLLEISSITTLNQTNVCTRYIFKEFFFLGKILATIVNLPTCNNEKKSVR